MNDIVARIQQTFAHRGNEKYADEGVTQLQHALQCAALARQEGAEPAQVVAALLHDIGHILGNRDLPADTGENLDDHHERVGYAFLKNHFGAAVADPVRLHVAAKRFLCTTDSEYQKRLSPTSYKSFLDQGGLMSEEELASFRSEPHFAQAVAVRRWDDTGKNPQADVPGIEAYLEEINTLVLSAH